jgi:hypothetical protein
MTRSREHAITHPDAPPRGASRAGYPAPAAAPAKGEQTEDAAGC